MIRNDKANKFVEAINAEAAARRDLIMQQAEEFANAEKEKARLQAVNESERLIERKRSTVKAAIARDEAHRTQALKQSLFAKREEIIRLVMDDAKAEFAAFAESESYDDFLLASCKKASESLAGGRITVLLRTADLNKKELIEKALASCTFEADDSIKLGGLKFRGSDGLVANDTLDERLSSQRLWCIESLGLKTDIC